MSGFRLIADCPFQFGIPNRTRRQLCTSPAVFLVTHLTVSGWLDLMQGLILWALSFVLVPVAILIKSDEWEIPSSKAIIFLVVFSLGNLFAQLLLNLSFKRLPLAVATGLIPSCVVWSVLIVEATQRVAPSAHAIAGMAIYAVSIGLLIARQNL